MLSGCRPAARPWPRKIARIQRPGCDSSVQERSPGRPGSAIQAEPSTKSRYGAGSDPKPRLKRLSTKIAPRSAPTREGIVHRAVERDLIDALGRRGRTDEIDERESPPFLAQPVMLAGEGFDEHATPRHTVDSHVGAYRDIGGERSAHGNQETRLPPAPPCTLHTHVQQARLDHEREDRETDDRPRNDIEQERGTAKPVSRRRVPRTLFEAGDGQADQKPVMP